jgi:two-component system NtrC family sensor kinase
VTTIAQLDKPGRLQLERKFQSEINRSTSLEGAAQAYTRLVYEALHESIVLLRVFATVPARELPAANRAFAEGLAKSAGHELHDDTLVLSLLGTMGVEPAWCHRRRSTNHLGIPLVSREFVTRIPMISRLLQQLGIELDWFDRHDTAIVGRTFGLQSGVFYVEDAAQAIDREGRNIITAQEFVTNYGVRTVYGVGGGYVGTPVFTTIITFCREHVDRARAEDFRTHIDRFKAETESLAKQGRIFADCAD